MKNNFEVTFDDFEDNEIETMMASSYPYRLIVVIDILFNDCWFLIKDDRDGRVVQKFRNVQLAMERFNNLVNGKVE